MTVSAALIDRPDRVRTALSPIRRQILERLREPASATQLAGEMALGRQRVNYHLRALEEAGLLVLVEERQRRGCVERILATRAGSFVVDPAVLDSRVADRRAQSGDRFAADHLIGAAAETVREVTRMQARADSQNKRLLTFTIESSVTLGDPSDIEQFSAAMALVVGRLVSKFNSPSGRRYRVLVGAHPASRNRAQNDGQS